MDMSTNASASIPARFSEAASRGVRSPFHNAPDPGLFFESAQHRQALETLSSALTARRGLFLLMGEIGTGKTTLCRYLQRTTPPGFRFGQISNPFVSPREFEDQILREFGLPDEGPRRDFFRALGEHLLGEHRAGRTVALLIDEGHLISLELFDHILILSNIQHDGVHLLQIILAGQPELQGTLQRPRFASLNQRISTRIFLTGLDRRETGAYIRHRLSLVPARYPASFNDDAVAAVWKGSGGIPRLINHICERVLAKNFEENGGQEIAEPLVREALNDPLMKPLLPGADSRLTGGLGRVLSGLACSFLLSLAILIGLSHLVPGFFVPAHSPAEGDAPPLRSKLFDAGQFAELRIAVAAPPPAHQDPPSAQVPASGASQEPARGESPAVAESEKPPQETARTAQKPASGSDPARRAAPGAGAAAQKQPLAAAAPQQSVRINAIVWHADPSQRLAVIDGDILREGRSSGGVKVIKINRDDVVLEHNGTTFSSTIERTRRADLQTTED
jgi:type II secretory pathway predicted ATPase ExeA